MANKLVSIIIATKNREEKLKKLLSVIRENTEYVPYEIIVCVDPDGQKYEFLNDMPEIVTIRDIEQNLSLSKKAYLCAQKARGDYLVLTADDIFPEKRWLSIAMEEMKNVLSGDGLVGFLHDNRQDDPGIVSGVVSKNLFLEIKADCYKHYFGDTELTEKMKLLKKCYKSTSAKITHIHEEDQTAIDDRAYYEEDKALFENRMAEFKKSLGGI